MYATHARKNIRVFQLQAAIIALYGSEAVNQVLVVSVAS